MTDHADLGEAVLTDLAADGDLDVTAWTDLDGLPADMEALAAQASAIVGHARTWACQRAGFEPSDLCLLQPLAAAMDLLADAFTRVESLALEDWADLRSGVRRTSRDLQAVDELVADRMPVVS